MDIDEQAKATIANIERYERRWHIFKSVLLAIGIILIIVIQFYTFHQILQDFNDSHKLTKDNHQLVCDIAKEVKLDGRVAQECK